jgi:eukaryotic-like serine/threonine-protein kinase
MVEKTFGRYEIVDELGQGGMAIVYLAHDPYVKRQVAIKVISQQFSADEAFRQRFQHEAEIVAALEHAAIVPIYDFGYEQEQSFIVVRYMPGGTLEQQLTDEPMKLSDVAPIIERVAAALDAAHAKGVIHRDIKPANIMFDDRGQAFLSDFGIAKAVQSTTGITGNEDMLGTVEYMSPEMIEGKAVNGRADIYALGIVLYRMLTGQFPFAKESLIATIMAHVSEPVPSVRELLPRSRVPWDDVLQKALAKDPDERYQTAGELAQDVNSLLSGRWYITKLFD